MSGTKGWDNGGAQLNAPGLGLRHLPSKTMGGSPALLACRSVATRQVRANQVFENFDLIFGHGWNRLTQNACQIPVQEKTADFGKHRIFIEKRISVDFDARFN